MSHKLDKETLDKVREIDGFPIGDDEDIINLSDPPYYTACPNPWIENFIKENGHPYKSEIDDYQKRSFSLDISAGKNEPIYGIHSYHTKIPPKAIAPFILHYTKPGDLIYDGFCGTGTTALALRVCETPDTEFQNTWDEKIQNIQWGARSIILSDLSPIAAFISYVLTNNWDMQLFKNHATEIFSNIDFDQGYLFKTNHISDSSNLDKGDLIGDIQYIVWSEKITCPHCLFESTYWDLAYDEENNPKTTMMCPKCKGTSDKNNPFLPSMETIKDYSTNELIKIKKQVPIFINYNLKKRTSSQRFKKNPDENDLNLIKKSQEFKIPYWFPNIPLMFKGERWGDSWRAGVHLGITHTHHLYSKRNMIVLSYFFEKINQDKSEIKNLLRFWFTASQSRLHRLNRYMRQHNRHVGPLSGTMYVSHTPVEISPFYFINQKLKDFLKIKFSKINRLISTQSSSKIKQIPDNVIDYIFTDPPFGSNLLYSELNFLLESWLKVFTNNQKEAIMNNSQKKGLVEYQEIMEQCFKENYRILKPGRWMTIVFHNSQNKVWMAIQEAIQRSGFIVTDVRVLDKKKGTTKQLVFTSGTVDKDLVISAYKPSGGLDEFFGGLTTGTEEGVWKFLNSHLKQLPVFVEKNDKVEVISERQKFLLFDRMVAFHIQKGLTVPISAAEFYENLNQKYVERDEMYFLSEQIPEYDQKRAQIKSIEQTTIFVEDEKSTILWLNEQLKTPQTYQDIQPKFLQDIHQNKFEKLPELSEILEQNFLEDGDGKWYIPDPSNLKDLEKIREKSLLREFQTYVESKSKLKQFRLESIRAGFKKKWSENDYKSIVDIAQRLPEQIIQEDSSLLMYYDNALSRLR